MEYFLNQFNLFLLIMSRMVGMFFVAPLFSSQSIPGTTKMAISFLITIVVFPLVSQMAHPEIKETGPFIIALVGEVMVGVIIGYLAELALTALSMAGQFFSAQMGFGMSEVLDPISQESIPLIGTLYNLMGMFIFLLIGGHYLLVRAVYFSYEHIQIFQLNTQINGGLMDVLSASFAAMFLTALKLSLPLIGTLFLASVSLGLASKAAPQMNILMLGFPINILASFIIIMALSPVIAELMQDGFIKMFDIIDNMVRRWPKPI